MIHTPETDKAFKKQIKESLDKDFMRKTLNTFSVAYRQSRANAFAELDLDGLRNDVACMKDEGIPHLSELFDAFKKNAEAAGTVIHVARDADEANRIIAEIAKENNVKSIVKSKSMTAEETFLNDHLEKDGYEVVETDLGEWIIQMRHEGPSHMVMPAIHLSRYQVGELFSGVTARKQDPEDIEGLVKVARKELRPKFINADMGVSGGNFAIADTGAIGLVTNEGNARLTTTLPRVHVALMGFDKLVPDMAAAMKILKILPRNATGQALTSYVTWIKGTNECATGPSGRKVQHIVFLDNGRLELAKDPIFAEALRCIRCGACANVCPIYRMVGGHTFGHVYIGAIGLILTPFFHGKEKAREIVKCCLNCQSCKSVCPSKIDLPYLIKNVYAKVQDEDGKKPFKTRMTSMLLKNRRLFHAALKTASKIQGPATEGPYIRHLPTFLMGEHNFRRLPAIADRSLRDDWKKVKPKVTKPALKVALFGGCAGDFIYPEHGKAFARLCEAYNIAVDYPMDQTCCGLPTMMMAQMDTAKEIAAQNVKAFHAGNYDYIVTLCASCGSHIKENFPKLLTTEGAVPVDVQAMADKLIDFSSFMNDVVKVKAEDFMNLGRKVTYHYPCHLVRGLDVTEAPMALLEKAGVNFTECDESQVCCGFSGSFSVDFPMISKNMLAHKLDNVEATQATTLVTDCPGCVLQLKGGIKARGMNVTVKHMAEVLLEEKK
ncbi:L-lactate dehydrogenase (quinone) large subunit LdhH [Desulfoluna butyratoxydans]|uniref:Lud domain n=1 Tax=Desulfoluna butyratoxydans TaxID=231438 RepID=A0A4U8YQ72_9BACT|nr:LUD domain-containing protein [Desulfoluna butyratoxydans]VFQ43872.1 lud domain [Desulfoluna butyratoxydans]